MLMLLGEPARRTTWHSVMPSATPPLKVGIGGAAPSGSSRSMRAGSVAGAAATGWAGGATAAGPEGAGSGGQLPSALTNSSGATGPVGPSWMRVVLRPVAQSGASNALNGFDSAPL